ncbi:MAG: YeeE/YedE family protein [Desulfobacterales bacterium]|nr:YeeE/YedE family protein [Desulfobacterales bacterium]
MAEAAEKSWKKPLLIIGIMIIVFTGLSLITGLWVFTAIPLGFLFGFFLEKADLCGASAFSEVLLMKDWTKIAGLWVIIAVSMIGFALISALGWVSLNPKPFIWANYLVGGVLFGIGIVLAGGCVSGCLFKSGQGNINSMAGLIGIPLGVAAVEYGPLHGFTVYLKSFIVKAADGGPVTLSSVTGLSYGVLAVIIGAITLAAAWRIKQNQKKKQTAVIKQDMPLMQRLVLRPWRPWQAGIAIGLLAIFAYMSSASSGRNYPLGVTHGVMHAQLLFTDAPLKHVHGPPAAPSLPKAAASEGSKTPAPAKKVSWWLLFEIVALVAGAAFSARLSGKTQFLPRPPDQTVIAFIGGILLGTGAAIAGGCVVGNIMSGFALMSLGNVLFGITVVLANWATTYFYLMGGGIMDK